MRTPSPKTRVLEFEHRWDLRVINGTAIPDHPPRFDGVVAVRPSRFDDRHVLDIGHVARIDDSEKSGRAQGSYRYRGTSNHLPRRHASASTTVVGLPEGCG